MSEKLVSLKKFLSSKNLHKEAYGIGRTILASEDPEKTVDLRGGASRPVPRERKFEEPSYAPAKPKHTAQPASGPLDETVALGPRSSDSFEPRAWSSPSERHVIAAGLEPVRFIAGTEAKKRGEGKSSAEGNVYEVLYNGGEAVAKVLEGPFRPEPDVWKRIIAIKDNLSEDESRHLPEIYEIVETSPFATVIVMEKLDSPNLHIRDVLRSKSQRDEKDVMSNTDFLSEALAKAFDVIDEYAENDMDDAEREIYTMFEVEKERLRTIIEGALFKRDISSDQISEKIQLFFKDYLDRFGLRDSNLTEVISDEIQSTFEKHLDVSEKPIAKYFSPKGIDETLKHLSTSERFEGDSSEATEKDRSDRIGKLTEERSNAVFSESPESFLYSQKYLPETRSFFSMLNSLKEFGIEWSDVHANNIMERPTTKELVLIDVGLFH